MKKYTVMIQVSVWKTPILYQSDTCDWIEVTKQYGFRHGDTITIFNSHDKFVGCCHYSDLHGGYVHDLASVVIGEQMSPNLEAFDDGTLNYAIQYRQLGGFVSIYKGTLRDFIKGYLFNTDTYIHVDAYRPMKEGE